MSHFDRLEDQIEKEYDDSLIDEKEYHEAMRELRYEIQEYAEEQAQQSYDDVMGGY